MQEEKTDPAPAEEAPAAAEAPAEADPLWDSPIQGNNGDLIRNVGIFAVLAAGLVFQRGGPEASGLF